MPNVNLAIERAARKYEVRPDVLKRLISAESGGNNRAVSPKGARGIAQFIPSTAKAYGVNLNDNRITDDLEGAAHYLSDNLKRTGGNYHQALSIYNSGRPDGYLHIPETRAYVQKILGGLGSAPSPATPGQSSTRTVPGMDRSAGRLAAMAQYASQSGRPGSAVDLFLALRNAQDTPAQTVTRSQNTAATSASGQFTVFGANPGRLKPAVTRFAEKVAGIYGHPLRGDSGATHSRLTVNGNVSDHWGGHATDIPARGHQLVAMGRAALIAAGMPRAQAMKQTGGLFNVNGHQVIFNTQEGGDHTDHLHISAY